MFGQSDATLPVAFQLKRSVTVFDHYSFFPNFAEGQRLSCLDVWLHVNWRWYTCDASVTLLDHSDLCYLQVCVCLVRRTGGVWVRSHGHDGVGICHHSHWMFRLCIANCRRWPRCREPAFFHIFTYFLAIFIYGNNTVERQCDMEIVSVIPLWRTLNVFF